jgi:hypothetical protein
MLIMSEVKRHYDSVASELAVNRPISSTGSMSRSSSFRSNAGRASPKKGCALP